MKRLCSIDIESTGPGPNPDPARDRIIQLGIVCIRPDGFHETTREFLMNPGVPISARTTAIHGFTDERVAVLPPFQFFTPAIIALLDGADLLGFNCSNYDIPLLWEEFHRAGVEWVLDGINIIDSGVLFKKLCPRTLEAAVLQYCGRKIAGAHDAVVDAMETWQVLQGQRKMHPELRDLDYAALAKLSQYDNMPRIDLAGKLIRNEKGEAVFNFSKVKGIRVADDLGFAQWMMQKDFSANTLMHLKHEVDKILSAQATDSHWFAGMFDC